MPFIRILVASLLFGLFLPKPVIAQSFPDRPVRLVVPFPPGGATDLAARLIADQLSKAWSQPVVVENRSGASGLIGTELVARARPDGYTVLMGTLATNVMAHLLQTDVPYARDAFAPIILLTSSPNILLANNRVPARTLNELIDYAKANPGKLRYSSAGIGLSGHLGVELFADAAKLDLIHVPYRGSAPAGQAFAAGEVDLTLALVTQAMTALSTAPDAKPLAIAAAKRAPQFPDTPTFAELGYPKVQVYAINGLMVPKGTPAPVISKIYTDASAALGQPDIRKQMQDLGLDIIGASPTEFGQFLEEEFARWEPLVSANRSKFQ